VAVVLLAAGAARAQDKPAGYAGSETCQPCHDEIFQAFQKNPHQQVEKRRKWQGMACESCHGPGAKHSETLEPADILNPARQRPAAADRSCLSCHLNQPTQVGRIHGGHARNAVACVSCHAVHKGAEQLRPRKADDINRECAGCHNSVWAEFQRPHKHPLPQGAMSCVDCHNPHGTLLAVSTRTIAANEPTCFRCHSDKRGPFAFEHAPMKTEGCASCHVAHGTANPRMLTRHEVRFLCLECHSNTNITAQSLGGIPPAFHDLRSPRFRNCTVCHVKIHGSYVDAGLER
jgi:DmsE family decaheme c-type cytochrome